MKGQLRIGSGADPVRGTAGQWAEVPAHLGTDQPFTSFVFRPEHETADQVAAFAGEVVPEARRLLDGRS
ncbi:hypothetical protein [Amycolatopsis sp. NBRC 101858]|uniref:hypothetical protein n=1 Tax=Amycolatopsis sp. NBRC 101858 TaxID=3032200 RepID=UPI002554A236|nr:hypothetical protein [Amycolatopsis sp. NBRC 101858]